MGKTRADFIREKVEELKAFDIVHELRTINTEASMGVPDVVPLDMVVEKLKPAFDALASAMEQLLNEAVSLASRLDVQESTVGIIDGQEQGASGFTINEWRRRNDLFKQAQRKQNEQWVVKMYL